MPDSTLLLGFTLHFYGRKLIICQEFCLQTNKLKNINLSVIRFHSFYQAVNAIISLCYILSKICILCVMWCCYFGHFVTLL